jgi:hypothetical protein
MLCVVVSHWVLESVVTCSALYFINITLTTLWRLDQRVEKLKAGRPVMTAIPEMKR